LIAALLLLLASPSCSVEVGRLDFGSYDPRSPTPTDFTAVIRYRCTGASPTIALVAPAGERVMRGANGALRYGLYLDAARTRPWGDGTAGTSVASFGQQAGTAIVHGRIYARQNVPAGAYADTISVVAWF
jgi:spore coat protein U-like protein